MLKLNIGFSDALIGKPIQWRNSALLSVERSSHMNVEGKIVIISYKSSYCKIQITLESLDLHFSQC